MSNMRDIGIKCYCSNRPCLDAWEHSDWEWSFHNKEHLTMASHYAVGKEAWLLSEVVIERLAQQGPWSRALEITEVHCAIGRMSRIGCSFAGECCC